MQNVLQCGGFKNLHNSNLKFVAFRVEAVLFSPAISRPVVIFGPSLYTAASRGFHCDSNAFELNESPD